MKYLSFDQMDENRIALISEAKEWACKSITTRGAYVGCCIKMDDGTTCFGATIGHSLVIGSTCAERMAIDKAYLIGKKPTECIIIGKLSRENWTEESVCTPCGKCLEMIWEFLVYVGVEDIDILCVSWDGSKILLAKLTEFFPRIETVKKISP